MKLKDIKKLIEHQAKPFCYSCGETVQQPCRVRINTTNPYHCYKGSGRSWVNVYSLHLCLRCFNVVEKAIEEIEFGNRKGKRQKSKK